MLEVFHDECYMHECLCIKTHHSYRFWIARLWNIQLYYKKIKLILLNSLYSEEPITLWDKEKDFLQVKLFHNTLFFLFWNKESRTMFKITYWVPFTISIPNFCKGFWILHIFNTNQIILSAKSFVESHCTCSFVIYIILFILQRLHINKKPILSE